MEDKSYKVYPYRWVVLLVFSLLNAVVQMNWITFAPVTVDAIRLYHSNAFWIVMLSMSFMIIYLAVSVPASYIIDKYGIRIGIGIGALLTAVFGYLRGAYADNFTMVCIAQFALAVSQPFVMNAVTKVSAVWFPLQERATANGITSLAQFGGIIFAMAVTKPLVQSFLDPVAGGIITIEAVKSMLTTYGIISVAVSVIFLIFIREKPPTPPCKDEDNHRISVFAGMKHIFQQRDMVLLLIIFFICVGIFNAISTYVDLLSASKGYIAGGNEAGTIGAAMLGAGVLGALVVSIISDKLSKRRSVLMFCLVALLPGLAGFTFFTSYIPLLISSAVFGFFLMGAAPVGYQYAAELSHPAPESTSQGLIILAGQISGIIFITSMALVGNVSIEAFADASRVSGSLHLLPFMIGFLVISVLNVLLIGMMKESPRLGGH